MQAGAITEYSGDFWRVDEGLDGYFDVMVLDRFDRSPWVDKPDTDSCYLCRELIPHSVLLHEDVIQHHIIVEEMKQRVLNEFIAGITKPEFTSNQVAALIYD
jgi:hypothetical protein